MKVRAWVALSTVVGIGCSGSSDGNERSNTRSDGAAATVASTSSTGVTATGGGAGATGAGGAISAGGGPTTDAGGTGASAGARGDGAGGEGRAGAGGDPSSADAGADADSASVDAGRSCDAGAGAKTDWSRLVVDSTMKRSRLSQRAAKALHHFGDVAPMAIKEPRTRPRLRRDSNWTSIALRTRGPRCMPSHRRTGLRISSDSRRGSDKGSYRRP